MLNIKGQKIINFATAVELFHTATLVHDDIIDESTLRRGEETIAQARQQIGALLQEAGARENAALSAA